MTYKKLPGRVLNAWMVLLTVLMFVGPQEVHSQSKSTSANASQKSDQRFDKAVWSNQKTRDQDQRRVQKKDQPSVQKKDQLGTQKKDQPSTQKKDQPSAQKKDQPSAQKKDQPSAQKKDQRGAQQKDPLGVQKKDQQKEKAYHRPTIRWNAPAGREDGSRLYASDIKEYRIYYRLRHKEKYKAISLSASQKTSYTLSNFPPGAYAFSVTVVDVNGRESRRSDQVFVNLI
jgi:hypothetical protein